MNSSETDSHTVMNRSHYSENLSHNSRFSTEHEILFFLMKQQLKKTLKKFMLYIVTVSIYILMKKIRSDFIKKLC